MRPYWRLDAKWLAALAAVLLILAASISYMLYRLTEHDTATGTAAPVIEAMTKTALSDELFAELQQAALSQPEAEVQTDSVTIPLRGKEIAGLSKEELLEKAAARLADILYYEGVDAGEAYFQDLTPDEGEPASADQAPSDREDDGLQLELLALFTKEAHSGLHPFALALPLAAAALLALLVLLSRGFGRLGSPGVALAVAVGPFALVTTVIRGALKDGQDNSDSVLAKAAEALYHPVAGLAHTFTVIAAIGLGMAALAIAGHVGFALRTRFSAPDDGPAAAEPTPADEAEEPSEAPFGGRRFTERDDLPSVDARRLPQP